MLGEKKIIKKLKEISLKIYRPLVLPFIHIDDGQRFVFIVGCYNSGTTLLNYMLGYHKNLSTLETEGVMLTKQLERPEDFGWNRMWHMCQEQLELKNLQKKPDAKRLKKEWAFEHDRSKPIWAEKSIINSLNIDWFETAFNHPYFIVLIRNGYAVAEGIQRRTSAHGRHHPNFQEGYPIELCAKQWIITNQVIEEKIKNVKNKFIISYEDLADNPRQVLNDLCGWLQIAPQAHIPDSFVFHEQERPICNMNKDSISRLTKEDIRKINKIASDHILRYGYSILEG